MNAFDEQLRSAFDGFEPNVSPDFAAFESALDRAESGGQPDLTRRYRIARRVAAASTAVAFGLFGWLMLQEEELSVQVNPPQEHAISEGAGEFEVDKFQGTPSPNLHTIHQARGEHAARTSSSVVIADESESAALRQGHNKPNKSVAGDLATTGSPKGEPTGVLAEGHEVAETARDASMPGEHESAPGSAMLGFESSVQEACAGTEVSFKLDGIWAEGSFLWNFGDGSFSSESEPSHVFDRPGTYDITISVRSHNDGQIRTRTVENMIVVRPRPEAAFDWEFAKAVSGKTVPVQLVNETERSSSSTWLLGEDKLNQAKAELKVPGEYPVHLIASNAYGCQDHATETLRLGNRLGAGAPSSFSPDGDGRYDTFLPRAAKEAEGAWEFTVFDAEGNTVFESTQALRPWDGSLSTGGSASGRRYTWVLKTTEHTGRQMLYTDVVRVE